MSKTNQRLDQTLRSFTSLLTVEKIVDNEEMDPLRTAYHGNNNEVGNMFRWKVPLERQKLFHSGATDRDNVCGNNASQILKDSATARTASPSAMSVPISPMLRGFLSSYSCGLNGTTCLLPALRIEETMCPEESLPTSVLKSFLKRGNPFPAATSYAKGKKKLQNRRRRSSKILVATSESLQNSLEDNKVKDKNEPSTSNFQYSFENMARNLSRPIFYSTESDSSNKDGEIKIQEKKDVASAPHILNSNIMLTIKMLMEVRMKHFVQTLVRKSIVKNNGQILDEAAAVMSHDLKCDALTEESDYNNFLRAEELNHSISILNKLSTSSKSDFDKKEKDLIEKGRTGDEETSEEDDIKTRVSKIKTTVTELSFLSDLKSKKTKKHRTAMKITRCITSFDVPRDVVGSVVKSRRANRELATKDKEENNYIDATEDYDTSNGIVGETRKSAKTNEKESTTSISTTEVTLPLTFAVIIDANMGLDNSTHIVLEFGCPGEIKGTFLGPTSSGLLTEVNIFLDTKLLLKAMENQIRFAIRKAIVLAMSEEKSIPKNIPFNDLHFSNKKLLDMSNIATGLHNHASSTVKKEYSNKQNPTVYLPEYEPKASAVDYDMSGESTEGCANAVTTRLLQCLKIPNNKPTEQGELGETQESKQVLFPKPTTHLNNIPGISTGKTRQTTPPLYQVSTFIPAHSCSALNEKKRKFSMQHAKTAAALSKNMNGIIPAGPGGASAIIPTHLLNLSQTSKTSNSIQRQSPFSRKLKSERRATIDTSQSGMRNKIENESSNGRRSSMPLAFATGPRKFGEKQKKRNATYTRNDEYAFSDEQKARDKMASAHSIESGNSKRNQNKTILSRKDKTEKGHGTTSNLISEEEQHHEESGLSSPLKRRNNEVTVNISSNKVNKVESSDVVEPVSTTKKRKASDLPHSELNDNDNERALLCSHGSSPVSNKEIKKQMPMKSPMSNKRRRGGFHVLQGSDLARPVDIECDDESESSLQRRNDKCMHPVDVSRRTNTSSIAESKLVPRRRSSNNSMAATAEAVMRMEAERRQSSSTSIAAAAEAVRRMEASLDDDSLAGVRRHSAGKSIVAAADVARRSLTAESLITARRRSSGQSMAASANIERRMEASLAMNPSTGTANSVSVSFGNGNVIHSPDTLRRMSLEKESAIAAKAISGNALDLDSSKLADLTLHRLRSSVTLSPFNCESLNATDYIGNLGLSYKIELGR